MKLDLMGDPMQRMGNSLFGEVDYTEQLQKTITNYDIIGGQKMDSALAYITLMPRDSHVKSTLEILFSANFDH